MADAVPRSADAPLEELQNTYLEARPVRHFTPNSGCCCHLRGAPRRSITRAAEREARGREDLLKREDLLHPARLRFNNCLARRCSQAHGQTSIIARLARGQHGVATATVCALFGFDCTSTMGEDMRRQASTCFACVCSEEGVPVTSGKPDPERCHREACATGHHVSTTHYCSARHWRRHPYPMRCRDFMCNRH